ncbi:heterokaryon incompatibility protein-domain-containing protein [Xylaria arbuscula]|nr:heterokaryon incompatibility protein-domain-containing protein [Xylaria arbuscula]
MSCAICNLFQGQWKISDAAEGYRRLNRNHIVSNLTWDEMRGSAKSCYCCDILISGCLGCFRHRGVRELDILQAAIEFYYPISTDHADEDDADKFLTFLLKDGRRFEVELFATEDDECPVPDSWDYIPVSRRASSQTDSAAAITTIKGWISGCIINHCPPKGFCDSPDLTYLPTRVVKVGLANGIVKLIETNGAKGRYMCLSHCWGKSQIITTTRSTLEQRKSGIVWRELSQTFRDAIWLTRKLGLQYIWIDSLCILQDDSKDWAVESAKMSSIYSNGYLTIAATHSENGYGGLFSQTEDFEVCGKTPDGEAYRLFFRERIDHHIELINGTEFYIKGKKSPLVGHPTVTYHPLLTRAWVYQERMLSTRVIHFGRYELFFECRSTIMCECGGIEFYGMSSSAPRSVVKIEYTDALWDYDSGDEQQLYQLARIWRTIVCSYTPLQLTKLKDRLPAIGGLAKDLARQRKSRYLAGLWEDTLNDDLLWVVHATSQHKSPRIYPRNAPTWSWASVETWVLYWDEILFSDVDDAHTQKRPPHEHYSKIETINVNWSSSTAVDEFGSVDSGLLRISGLVARGVLERETEQDGGGEDIIIQHYVRFASIRLQIKADYLLDYSGPAQTNPETDVFCLRMSRIQGGSTDHLISLVLKRSPEHDDLFERIGTLVIMAAHPPVDPVGEVFKDAGLWTVSII